VIDFGELQYSLTEAPKWSSSGATVQAELKLSIFRNKIE
jgi:hypothetical protein